MIVITNSNLTINGREYEIPKHLKGKSYTIINNKVFIDGYELKNSGEWKRTLRALYHKYLG